MTAPTTAPTTAPAARLGLRDYALLALAALVLLAPGLTSLPPIDRDESRYAVASAQMLAGGDFVDIRFQDQPRYLQPAGIYWLQSASVAVFSDPEARAIWAHRLPSLFAAVAAALLTGAAAAALFGRTAGIAAALLLAACFSLGFEARNAKTDAVLLLCVCLSQLSLLKIHLDPAGPRRRAALFWAALGAGMMVKGPIILLVSGLSVAALLVWDRRAAWLKGLHAHWGVLVLLAVVLPWYVAIGLASDGDFYARAVGKNLLGKVGAGQQSHDGPPGYHLGLLTLAFWPASLFAVLAAPFAWRRRNEPTIRFLIAWIVPTFVLFEAVATKLPHYVLPTYPALAVLAAAAFFGPGAADAPASRRLRIAGGIYAVLWTAAGLALAALPAVGRRQVEGDWSAAAIAVGAAAGLLVLAAVALLARRRPAAALGAAVGAAALTWTNIYALTAPGLQTLGMSPRIAAAAAELGRCGDAGVLISTPYHEPSLVFLNGSQRTVLAESPAAAARRLAADPACGLALVGTPQEGEFLAAARAAGLSPAPVRRIEGVNYSDGDEMRLTVFAAR